jgi:hypothetical protein
MTSLIGYIMLKLPVYFNSHMRIDEQITNIFLSEFIYSYRTVVHTNIAILVLFLDIYVKTGYKL